ncbi:MAG TPA: HAMP domain-containing sensor histidine kinase, partial [Anaerovoracaceae bacterium]|nr:HAMP domain-containing sensor histidine kinase [Anaerovoracaceae bacterium]
MKSIRFRLTVNFMIVILISVIVLEMMLIYTIKQNYYGSLKGNLTNQIKISAGMYSRYYSDTSLEDNILYNVDAFWNQSDARVEIVNTDGEIIMDSSGKFPHPDEAKDDIYLALKGKMGEWVGRLDDQKVMAVSYPLKSGDEIVGILRFVASTEDIDDDIKNTIGIFIAIGIFVVIAVGLLSVFLTNSIVVPLKEVTNTAGMMAQGNFLIRNKKRKNDEIGKLSDTLNYMADEIDRKEKLKNDFISSVSHELRTPLTSIMGWAITLQNEKFREKETLTDGLGIIAKECERLTAMVEELLDFSKFVSGRIRLEHGRVNLKELMNDIHNQMKLRAMRKEINFIVSYPENIPALTADGNRLKQLFINILDNAFNFTDVGGTVSFHAE